MNHRRSLVVLGAGLALVCATLSFGSVLSGCGEYHVPDQTGGSAGSGALPGTGGQMGAGATGGAGGSTGGSAGAAVGGGAGSGATGGTDMAGTGGSSAGSAAAGMAGMAAMAGSSSGGSGGMVTASCDNVMACGGDVVGTWAAGDACIKVSGNADLSGFGLGCNSAPLTGMLAVTGTFTANADGTYEDDTSTTGSEVIELPPPCLTISGTTTTCDRVGGPLSSLGYSKVQCVDNAATSGCTCTATVDQSGGIALVSALASSSGNYMVADTTLSISDGVHDLPYSYCVEGNTLTISTPSMSKTGTATGTVVLQKQ